MKIEIDLSDLQKIGDALSMNVKFHKCRDEMNASAHLAGSIRYSPITSETEAALDRVHSFINAQRKLI